MYFPSLGIIHMDQYDVNSELQPLLLDRSQTWVNDYEIKTFVGSNVNDEDDHHERMV